MANGVGGCVPAGTVVVTVVVVTGSVVGWGLDLTGAVSLAVVVGFWAKAGDACNGGLVACGGYTTCVLVAQRNCGWVQPGLGPINIHVTSGRAGIDWPIMY